MSRITKILFLLALVPMLACERRPLYDPESAVGLKVRLVTDGIHNVTCDIYNPNVEVPAITSEMLRIFVYDQQGDRVLSQGFASKKSIENGYEVFREPLQLSVGSYKLLSYNFDLDLIRITQESSYNTIEASTIEVPQYYHQRFGSRAGEIGNIYYPPEHLMVARAPELTIEEQQTVRNIELDAHTIVDTYYVQIRIKGAENMAKNASCQAVLTGVSPANCFGPNIRNYNEPSSIYFEMHRNTDPNTPQGGNEDVLCALFNTFGKIPTASSELQITLSVLTKDGKTHQKVVDMSSIFESEEAREHHWLLIEEEWEIPKPIVEGGGGGFTPEVDEWEDVEETIPIGPRN